MEHNIVNISLGENCLMDALLSKYGIKQESYAFGSVRTNIEYNLEIIKDNFEDFLKSDLLVKKTVNGTQKVYKNKKYSKVQNDIYCSSVIDSFEFTHHNVLDNNKDIDSYNRKIERTKIALESNDIIFWYHYRYSTNNNLEILIKQFDYFIKYLSKKNNKKKYQICIFTQIVSDDIHFINEQYNNNINIVKCYEKNIWCRNNVGGNVNDLKSHTFTKVFDKIFKKYNLYDKLLKNFDD